MTRAFLDGFLDFTNTPGRASGGAQGGATAPDLRVLRGRNWAVGDASEFPRYQGVTTESSPNR
jgi:hypothetical protein